MSKKAEKNWGRVWSEQSEMDCRVAIQHISSAIYYKWRDIINGESQYPDMVGTGQIHDIWNYMYEDMKALYTLEKLVNDNYKTVIIQDEKEGGDDED